jgi:hypothetical protein
MSSYAGLTRVSINLRKKFFQGRWMAGSSPAMTPSYLYPALLLASAALTSAR